MSCSLSKTVTTRPQKIERQKRAEKSGPCYALGVRSGLRISELLALRVDQVWDGTKVVDRFYIRRHATKGKEAGASIVMHPEAAQFLFRWIKAGKLSGDPHGYPSFKQEEIDRAILSI